MKINDVCKETKLTKKAINYYEDKGLISPYKDENGYRVYSSEDIKILKEICIYRRLDIPVKDIKKIIKSKDKNQLLLSLINEKQSKIIEAKKQERYLKLLISSDFDEEKLRQLNEEIISDENNNGVFIKNELKRAFPGGVGIYFANHFAPYLNESIDTKEKYDAWINIIEFLDNIEEFKIPKFLMMYYQTMSEEMIIFINNAQKAHIEKILYSEGEELEDFKKDFLKYVDKQNDKSLLSEINPFVKMKKQMYDYFEEIGYNDVFLPNLKILSNSYKEYSDKLNEVNDKICKELGVGYDENMRIVRLNEKRDE